MKLSEKLFGTHSTRELKRVYPIVDKIEALRPEMTALTDEELKGKTKEFKDRLANGETLDDLLVEAFAVVREAARHGALPGTAHRWYHPASGANRRDAYR